MFNSYVNVYQRVNLHFLMVFLWFSYGFPMVSGKIPHSHPRLAIFTYRGPETTESWD